MVKTKVKSKSKNATKNSDKSKSKQKVPGGVIAFGVIHIIIYSLSLIGNLINLAGTSALQRTAQIMSISYEYLLISAIVGIIVGGFALSGGIMILSLKELGRKFMVNIAILVISLGILNTIYLISTTSINTELGLITIIFSIIGLLIGGTYQGLILWYFNKRYIRKIFS